MRKKCIQLLIILALAGTFVSVPTSVLAVCVQAGTGDIVSPVNGRCPDGSFDPSVSGPDGTTPPAGPMTLFGLLAKISILVGAAIPTIMALTVLVIVWGVFRYIASGDEEEKREEGKKFVIYGIVGLFIMVSIWGLVNILKGTLHLSQTPANIPALPDIPGAKK